MTNLVIHDHAWAVTVHRWQTGEHFSPEFVCEWEPDTIDSDEDGPDCLDNQEDTFASLDEALDRARHLMRERPECCQ